MKMKSLYSTLFILGSFPLVWLLLLVPFVAGQSSTTTVAPETSAPETTDLPSWFQGYYFYPQDDRVRTSIVACSHGKEWVTRGDYATCCDPNPTGEQCGMATSCSGDEIEFDTGNVVYCGAVCASMVIYETSPFGGPSATNYFCHDKWTINTVYRQLPESTTTTTTTTEDDTTSSSPTTTFATTTSPLTYDNDNDSGNNEGDGEGDEDKEEDKDKDKDKDEEKSSSNNGWIAGVVIGPLAGSALIAVGFWYLWRRKQNTQVASPPFARHISPPVPQRPAEYYTPTPITKSAGRLHWNSETNSYTQSPSNSYSHSHPQPHTPPATFVSRTMEPRELENSELARGPAHELSGDSSLR